MPIEIVERDKETKDKLTEKLKEFSSVIFINVNQGFKAVLGKVETGVPVIVYGKEPHTLGDQRFLGLFDKYDNVAYVTFPEGTQPFLETYNHLMRR
jgi:hypothetical protein